MYEAVIFMFRKLYQEKGLGGNAMSREKLKELLRKRSTKIGSVVLAAALVLGGGIWATRGPEPEVVIPELVSFVDPVETVVIEDEETPLAKPKVTKKTKTKKKTKKIKLKKASKKTYTQKGKTTTKKSSKLKTNRKNKTETTIDTTEVTSIQYKFKKGSKIKTQITTIKTTTVTTVKTTGSASSNNNKVAAATNPSTGKQISGIMAKRDQSYVASKVDARVMNAFNKLGFQIVTDPGAASAGGYTGYFDANSGKITVSKMDGTVYHELGHFLSFLVGNYCNSGSFQSVYAAEKSLYAEYNKDYAVSSASEYFAESFCQYVLDPGGLSSARPQTYKAIVDALSRVTDAQVNGIKAAYGVLWQ